MKLHYMLPILPVLAFASCQQAPDAVASDEESEAVGNFVPPQPVGEGESNMTEKPSPDGAVAVVKAYFDAVRSGRSTEAYRMWGNKGHDSGTTDAQFAAHIRSFKDIDVAVEDPGQMEGAAGSIYIEIPVKISGVSGQGMPLSTEGVVTLRRVNNVPGADPDSLRWHIVKSTLPTRP